MPDRFGLGWRHKLALGILSHLDRIDIVEVMPMTTFARLIVNGGHFARLLRRRRIVARRNTWSRFGGCS